MSLNSTTNITSFSLQARDWYFLAISMADSSYNSIMFELQTNIQVTPAPANTNLITITNTPLGLILRLHKILNQTHGKSVGKNQLNRFREALVSLSLQEVDTWLSSVDDSDSSEESNIVTYGRRFLRGKLE